VGCDLDAEASGQEGWPHVAYRWLRAESRYDLAGAVLVRCATNTWAPVRPGDTLQPPGGAPDHEGGALHSSGAAPLLACASNMGQSGTGSVKALAVRRQGGSRKKPNRLSTNLGLFAFDIGMVEFWVVGNE